MNYFLLIDEEAKDREAFTRFLAERQGEIVAVEPAADLGFLKPHIDSSELAGVLVDFGLAIGNNKIDYNGATLAAHIRSRRSDIPILVLSAALPHGGTLLEEYRRIRSTFDLRLDKPEVADDPAGAKRILHALADGFHVVARTLQADGAGLPSILGVTSESSLDLVGWIRSEVGLEASAISRFIVATMIGGPAGRSWRFVSGPLLTGPRAVAALGLLPDEANPTPTWLAPARYAGVFASLAPVPLFWASTLRDCELPSEAPQATCGACGGPASYVCEVCGKLFDGMHSLPVVQIGVSSRFQQGRICGFCIQEGVPRHVALRAEAAELVGAVVAEANAMRKQA